MAHRRELVSQRLCEADVQLRRVRPQGLPDHDGGDKLIRHTFGNGGQGLRRSQDQRLRHARPRRLVDLSVSGYWQFPPRLLPPPPSTGGRRHFSSSVSLGSRHAPNTVAARQRSLPVIVLSCSRHQGVIAAGNRTAVARRMALSRSRRSSKAEKDDKILPSHWRALKKVDWRQHRGTRL